MEGGTGNPGEKARDESKKETEAPPQANPENPDDTVAPGQPQSDLVLRKLRDLLEKNEVTPDLERDLGMSKSDIEQFVRKYEKKRAETAEAGRTIDAKAGNRPSSDKPSSELGTINPNSSFSTKSERDGGAMSKDQVRDNIEGVRFQVPPELRGKYEGYVNRLSRSRGTPAKGAVPRPKPQPAPVSP